mmetsp:Transcript_24617/g.26934  ORF Transcript_24617/g.26934 Transcript_24617/m.26934 type:complete len:144 (-) Transcript_24617:601-1032(-)
MEDPFFLLRNGHLERLKELIESEQVDMNQTRWSGFTLLHRAAEIGCTDICVYLVQKGMNPNLRTAKGWYTPLHIALGNGYFETALALVDLGGDPYKKNKYRENPFEFGGKRGFKTACDNFRVKISKREIAKTAVKYLSGSRDE